MKKGLKLIDNSSREYQLGNILKELLNDESYSQISIATGYWDLPGMVELYAELNTFFESARYQHKIIAWRRTFGKGISG